MTHEIEYLRRLQKKHEAKRDRWGAKKEALESKYKKAAANKRSWFFYLGHLRRRIETARVHFNGKRCRVILIQKEIDAILDPPQPQAGGHQKWVVSRQIACYDAGQEEE